MKKSKARREGDVTEERSVEKRIFLESVFLGQSDDGLKFDALVFKETVNMD